MNHQTPSDATKPKAEPRSAEVPKKELTDEQLAAIVAGAESGGGVATGGSSQNR